MPIGNITSSIISTLGSPSSLAPIIVKDGVVSTSLTSYSSKAGGKVEGMDRAIDEFGTEAIWIGGIPFFKKLIDLTAYKLAKINPDVDIRVAKDKEYATWAIDNAKGAINKKTGQSVKQALVDATQNVGKTKSLFVGKVIAATIMTLASYFALTKSKQKFTKGKVEQEIAANKQKQEKANKQFLDTLEPSNPVFNKIANKNQASSPSFKGLAQSVADGILFNPVHNMKLIDAGITTERLTQSRNKTEFAEYSIKEGSFLFFIYGSGYFIQKGFDKMTEKVFKKPINLDIKVLMSDELKKGLSKNTIKGHIEDVEKVVNKDGSKLTDFLDFVVKNPDNIAVKAAKQSGIISTVKDSEIVDTSKFIDKKEFMKIAKELKKIDTMFTDSTEDISKFLNKTKGLKIAAVLSNIVICCVCLGKVVPELMYKYREAKTGSKKFHVAEDIKKAEGAS